MRMKSDPVGNRSSDTKDTGAHTGGGGPLMVKHAENDIPRPMTNTIKKPPPITKNRSTDTKALLFGGFLLPSVLPPEPVTTSVLIGSGVPARSADTEDSEFWGTLLFSI